jgi:hypothetical protein
MSYMEQLSAYLNSRVGVQAESDFRAHVTVENQRYGQAFMNALGTHAPEKYEFLTSTQDDPFYLDYNIEAALQALMSYEEKGPL